jgi:cytochrome P450
MYQKWSKEYGKYNVSFDQTVPLTISGSGLIYFRVRGRHVIVNNKLQIAHDLLEDRKRNLNYSSRPDFPMMDLIGRQDNVGFQTYGPRLKKCRKLLHDTLSARFIPDWSPRVRIECDSFLADLLKRPEDIESAVLR